MQTDNKPDHRLMCYDCFRPDAHCVCKIIKPVKNETGIIILQHPAERNHPFGTARIAMLSLAKANLEIAWPGFARQEALEEKIPLKSGILYPSQDALDLDDCPEDQKPENLVILDGTWNTARTIYNTYPNLRNLPHYKISPVAPSGYKIRKAPKAEHRSTIEAIWQALTILEPSNSDLEHLITAFHQMIAQQVQYQKTHPAGPRRRTAKKQERKPLPTVFSEDFDKLIVGYGEFFREPKTKQPHQLYYWTAHKPSTGQTFSMGIRPTDADTYQPSDEEIAWMGLTPKTIFEGATQTEFLEAWHEFAGEDYILGTWNQITRRLFEKVKRPKRDGLQIKRIYCNVIGRACGPLSGIIDDKNLQPDSLPVLGRAQERLSQAVAMSLWLHNFELQAAGPS
ncbi:MAG: DTW domain-containing protein [Deltaproteobacteria bacterium]|jgi:DTW domain-containing protein|nr:DTW domain-containing protein [Deltaproteobacteria bacterium]MBT6490984.1 DTW domain-containing protein [Deltaproteobacteria bacterium]